MKEFQSNLFFWFGFSGVANGKMGMGQVGYYVGAGCGGEQNCAKGQVTLDRLALSCRRNTHNARLARSAMMPKHTHTHTHTKVGTKWGLSSRGTGKRSFYAR